MAKTFSPPAAARQNARKVLRWRKEHGDQVRGMTRVGWGRATQLASGRPVSLDVVKRMAQFARHRQNAAVAPEFKNEPWRDRGHVAWLGWGGDEGIAWAKRVSQQETTKAAPPNYRKASGRERCGNCRFFRRGQRPSCIRYNANCKADMVCDGWMGEREKANKPTNPALWKRATAEAKRRFAVYPSAYANAWAAKWYKDKGGGWTTEKDLRQWFREEWVDISRPIRENGKIVGYKPCGRSAADREKYPKCLPKRRAMKLTPLERARLIRRKREQGLPEKGKPAMTSSATKEQPTKRHNGRDLPVASFLVVADPQQVSTWHLPVADEDGNPDRRLMGAAKAALTVGYRGSKYQGPDKDQARLRLARMYRKMNVEPHKDLLQKANSLTYKHGTHDQRSHGRRGGAGGKSPWDLGTADIDTKLGRAFNKFNNAGEMRGVGKGKITYGFRGWEPQSRINKGIRKLNRNVNDWFSGQGYEPVRGTKRGVVSLRKGNSTVTLRSAGKKDDYYLFDLIITDSGTKSLERARGLLCPKYAGDFIVLKQADGRYRWITRSSNAFRDRDGEIVSRSALREDVARADRTKEYGPLRFWHMPGVDVGECDFNWLRGRTLIESGTFNNDQIARKVAQKAGNYQVSIGFRHPPDQPDKDGVFHTIRRFERSLVPAGRAANPFTSLSVKEQTTMSDYAQKAQALKALLDDDDLLRQVLAGADHAEKTADTLGISFKDTDLTSLSADELLEYAIARKESEMEEEEAAAAAAKKKNEAEDEEGAEVSMKMGDVTKKMGEYTMKMGQYCDRMEKMLKMLGERKKEADGDVHAVKEATNVHAARIQQLEQQLAQATASLKELQADLPAGLSNPSARPTQADDNVVPGAAPTEVDPQTQTAVKSTGSQSLDDLLSFTFGPNGGGA